MEKPVLGPMVRAAMLVLTVLFALYWAGALTLGDAAARDYPQVRGQASAVIGVWAIAIIYSIGIGWVAYRVVRERFPPRGVYVFPALRLNAFAEIVMSVAGGLLLLPFPLLVLEIPLMQAEIERRTASYVASGYPLEAAESRQLDPLAQGGPLLVFLPFVFMLLLWRPIFQVQPGRAIVRYRIGGWLPWTQRFAEEPTLAFTTYYSRRKYGAGGEPLGHMLQGTAGEKTFDMDFVAFNTPPLELERLRQEWRARLAGAPAPRG